MNASVSLVPQGNLPRAVDFIGGWPGHVFSLGRCVRCHRHVWDDPACTSWDPWKWMGDALSFMRVAHDRGYSIRFEYFADSREYVCFVSRGNTNEGVVHGESAAEAITDALCEAMGWGTASADGEK